MADHRKIEIRFDDVLLFKNLTGSMKNSLRYNSFFGHFKKADNLLNEYPCILTVLADGIPAYPDWVQYIKERPYFRIEMHGESHFYYENFTEQEGYDSLARAKDAIEKAFDTRVTRWYVPFGRLRFPDWGSKVCDKLGIRFHTRGSIKRDFYFHYWNSRDRLKLEKVMTKLFITQPHIFYV